MTHANYGAAKCNQPPFGSIRLFVLARHGESVANLSRRVSSDPSHLVPLTAQGESQARQLGSQLAAINIDVAVATGFLRTQQTIKLALEARRIPMLVDRDLDDIRAGELDGVSIEDYWYWKEHHAESERFPHGESIDDALLRYAKALQRLLSRTDAITLVVLHEFALRRIATAASDTEPFPFSNGDISNAVPYLFDESAIGRAAKRLEARAESELAHHRALA